jgi:hypothetical protein
MTRWLTVALALAFAGAAWAGAPVELATDPPSNDPIPRCVVDSGSSQGDQLSILRTGCDVLSFINGFKHGHIRPCNDAQESCNADGNGNACSEGDQLWLCLAN